MAHSQQPYLPYLNTGASDVRVPAIMPSQHFFASPASYGHLPFGPRTLPQQIAQVPPMNQYAQRAGPDLSALRVPSFSSLESPLSPADFVGPQTPFFPAMTTSRGYMPPSVLHAHAEVPHLSGSHIVAHAAVPQYQATHQLRLNQYIRPNPPPASPTLSRTSSSSRPPVGLSPTARREEPRKRKLVVRMPAARTGIATVRNPLPMHARQEIERRMDGDEASFVALEDDELVSRSQHFDEIPSSSLPDSLDVYLPGRLAWQDVWDALEESVKNRSGPAVDLRRPDFLQSKRHRSHESSQAEHPRAVQSWTHHRSASLFSTPSLLPPRLRSAVESSGRSGLGHRATASMFPGSSPFMFDRGLDMPTAESMPPPQSVLQASAGLRTAPPRSASGVSSRTDATGIASLSANGSAADSEDAGDNDPDPADLRSHRSNTATTPSARSDDSQYGDVELSDGDDDELPAGPAGQRNLTNPRPREFSPSPDKVATASPAADQNGLPPQYIALPDSPIAQGGTTAAVRVLANAVDPAGAAIYPSPGFGQPGSLTVSTSKSIAIAEGVPSPKRQLSALASDFVPESWQTPSSSLVTAAEPSFPTAVHVDLKVSQSGTGSTARRPLPPLPTVAPLDVAKRSEMLSDSTGLGMSAGSSLYPALELIHPQPRRPLPTPPMSVSTPSPTETSFARHHDHPSVPATTDREDSIHPSSLSMDDPLPEQYKPPRSVLRHRLALTAVIPPSNDMTPNVASTRNADPLHARAAETSPARMGDPRARQYGELSLAAPKAGSLPRVDDPASANESVATEPDDLPLRILETLITEQFTLLRADLVARPASDSSALEARISALEGRFQACSAEAEERILAAIFHSVPPLLSVSTQVEALPQKISAAMQAFLLEKVNLESLKSAIEAMPAIQDELCSLREAVTRRIPGTPSHEEEDLGTSESTLVKSVTSASSSFVQHPQAPRLSPDSEPALPATQSCAKQSPDGTRRELALLEARLAAQERRTAQLYDEREVLREALEAALHRGDTLQKSLRSLATTEMYQHLGQHQRHDAEESDGLRNADSQAGLALQDMLTIHSDITPSHTAESTAYSCSTDGWFSLAEPEFA
ncbi:hypothetical protein JCM10908_001078 [Rhodotorula pacifica]|uniref:uncharacterized protein n=1 Tax=Rhodotorula pacifica TaxID=1495444 RepID=UPI003174511A